MIDQLRVNKEFCEDLVEAFEDCCTINEDDLSPQSIDDFYDDLYSDIDDDENDEVEE